jgi:hypothetical protein
VRVHHNGSALLTATVAVRYGQGCCPVLRRAAGAVLQVSRPVKDRSPQNGSHDEHQQDHHCGSPHDGKPP